jgi:putative transposase
MTINPVARHRRSIRLQGYDYTSAGVYFITIVTQDRKCLFGDVVNGQFRSNDWGQIVQDEWDRSALVRREIELDGFITMPNHVHAIIVIPGAMGRATGRSPLQSGPAKRSLGAFVGGFKPAVTKRIKELRGSLDTPIWQRNYFEHIIRNEESLNRIRQYIFDNPVRWEFDRENPFAATLEPKDVWRI